MLPAPPPDGAAGILLILLIFFYFFQLFSEAEEGCKQRASAAGITLPQTFSIARAFEEMATKGVVNAPLLRAAGVLRRNGGCWGGADSPFSQQIPWVWGVPGWS